MFLQSRYAHCWEGRTAGFEKELDWQQVNAVIFALWVWCGPLHDDGTEHCWCFLSCAADMSRLMAKSISVVNAGLHENPSLPASGSPEGDLSTCKNTLWGPLFSAEQQRHQSQTSDPLKISFCLLRTLLLQDVRLQAVLHCTAGKLRQPPSIQTFMFFSSGNGRPTKRHPAQQAQCLFICACCCSAVFKVAHAVVVRSLCTLIYSIAYGQWLIIIIRALTDFAHVGGCSCLSLTSFVMPQPTSGFKQMPFLGVGLGKLELTHI